MKCKNYLCICVLSTAILLIGCGGTEIRSNSNESTASQTIKSHQLDNTVSNASSCDSKTQTKLSETNTMTDSSRTTTFDYATTNKKSTHIQTKAAISTTQANTTLSASTDITSRLNAIFSPVYNGGGKYSLKVISLNSNESINVGNCNSTMTSASLIKLYVAGAVYENMDKVKAFESYTGETEQLISKMISVSDNNACNTLVKRLGNGDANTGMGIVNSYCKKYGFNNTQMNRLMLNFNGLENYTTPTDCCNILKSYYNKQLKGSENIISYMKAQKVRTKIPSGITDGTVVANKTGELASVENDSAIVYSANGVYILCVMTQDLTNTAIARNAIVQAASVVHQHQLQKGS